MSDDEKDTFAETMDNLNRAVEWCRVHLAEFTESFAIHSGSGLGVEISFGVCYGECGPRVKSIEKLFAGKCVSRTYEASGDAVYRFSDVESQIDFRWHVASTRVRSEPKTELVTL